MRLHRWRSWLGAVGLGISVVSTMPARAGGAPRDKPAANVADPAEAQRLGAEAVRLYNQGQYDEAVLFGERALSLREQTLGPDHPAVATSLNNLAAVYQAKGDYARAEPLYERALRIQEKALGPDHPDVAASLNNLAWLYQTKGDYARAEPLYERALRIQEKALGQDHPAVATSLNNLAMLYEDKGDYARAEPLHEAALRIREKALGQDHPDVAQSLNNIAALYQAKGEYGRAEPLFERALRIQDKALGQDHPAVATSLNNLAALYQAKGEYARAAPLYERALRIQEKALDPFHPAVATSLNNLAWLYQSEGEYGRAEPLFERALRIQEKALGPFHPAVATSLNNLAEVYQAKGDYARAEPLKQRALRIREDALGQGHPDVAQSLNNLAGLYQAKGEYGRAEPLFERALRIREDALGEGHPAVATSLNNLAALYQVKGDYAHAEPLFERALRIQEKALGPSHPDVATSLNNLAGLYQAKGDYARAEPLFEGALRISSSVLGEGHPSVARSLDNLATLYAARGRSADAVQAQQRSAAIQDHNATRILATGSETQRRAYMATLTDETYWTISLHVKEAPSNMQAARLALTTLLRRKGRVLDAMASSIAALRSHLTHDDQALLDQLSSVMSQLGAEISRGPGKRSAEQYKKNIQELEDGRQKLEEEIGKRSAEFRADQRPLTLEQVQGAIPEGAALLEIFRYEPFNAKGGSPADRWGAPRYVAYVLGRHDDPSFTDLGLAAPVEAAVQKLRAALADPDLTHDPRPAARAVDALVMQPIRALLGATRWVLLSPDDALNLIPFEALVDEQGRYLIERFAFTYLTSGRDLIRLSAHAAPKQGAVVVADPDFGVLGASPRSPSQEPTHRGLRSVELTRARFMPLASTAEEARAIAGRLPGARVLLSAEATEGAIKAVKAPWVLHLATHGFFFPQEPEPKLAAERRSGLGLSPTPQEIAAALQRESPLLRAGLALAGANRRVSGDKDDGILTALEVSGLNLYGTKLVVLSACQTGLGDAVSGEGVYGLRRALVMAGAETQVMSLWEVDSGRTQELMVAYYERLKAGGGRSEALRQVQLEMLGRKETSHPNLWASFIVSGDWRALDEAAVPPDFKVHPGPRGCACAQAGEGRTGTWRGAVLAALLLCTLGARLNGRGSSSRAASRRGSARPRRRGDPRGRSPWPPRPPGAGARARR